MVFGSIVSSPPLGSFTPQKALDLAHVYLENANNASDRDIALVLCHDTEVSLSQAKKAVKHSAEDPTVVEGIATAYVSLGKLLEKHDHGSEAQAIYKLAAKQRGRVQVSSRPATSTRLGDAVQPQKGASFSATISEAVDSVRSSSLDQHKQPPTNITIPAHIFVQDVRPPAIEVKLPESDERLHDTPQLACCLGLLNAADSLDYELEPAAQKWLQAIEKDTEEQERLHLLATEIIRAFKRDELKDSKAIAEVVYLSPVVNKEEFQYLLREFYSGIDHSGLLDIHQLEGLARLIQGAGIDHLSSDDLVKILGLFSTRLRDTHQQSEHHIHQLTLAVSHVLDAMADTKVTDLDRKKLHEPLLVYLKELKNSSDPYLVYQAAYAFQALLCVPDDEKTWQAVLRRTGKVFQGVSGLVSAVKALDLNKFIEGLEDIQKGLAGTSKVADLVQSAYKNVTSLAESGQSFLDCLKEGFSFDRKRDWYTALRGADAMIRDGKLATFRKLVCDAPCRLDPAFQWGVCQRLGEIASNPMWDTPTRRGAITFLGEIYKNDSVWGQQSSVKQWILNILMHMASSSSGTGLKLHAAAAETLLQELETNGDAKKQALYRASRENGPIAYPLKIALPELGSPSLLDRVQNRPDVEGNIRQLKKQHTKERGNTIYIPPQAKSSIQAADDDRFPLMEKVKQFLESDQKVFLILGDSGAGKSTFNKELEYELWQTYKTKTGRIPLFINLPAIDRPEHDMIAKQLRKSEFTEAQIREMKHHRRFTLICDGYDESQQTHNLYMSNKLNQPGEWNAQMVISCRTEYVGTDYRDRFRSGDRNQRSDSSLFQEAVVAPFSPDQVQAYIQQYVSIHQPLWQVEDYKQALDLIPSLNELVKNPFLMALSLDVLPRLVEPGQQLSAARVTRVSLYDHFVEQWLERGKKRIGEKDLTPQVRVIFENLSDEGFTQNGIDFLKRLAVAIYKEQGGQPVVEYARFKDEGSWKDEFFGRKDKRLIREACPMTRNGNQHRFIHRSLLEYGLALAVFDPHDPRNRAASAPDMGRRGSASSSLSFESHDGSEEEASTLGQEPILDSPLVWKYLVNDYSLVQFLEERVQQEPVFKGQLLAYIERSKKDKKWRKAAANAITILVRSGMQFIDTDLRGIQIPRADLSYGVFDSVQLQDADLRKVNLRGVWMRQTDLSGAQMTGVQFGELPYLMEDDKVDSCTYSPDGKSLAVGLWNGDVTVYATSDWERTRILKGHTGVVRRVVYSPIGNQMASASQDKTVRLWDVETGVCGHVLTGHGQYVYGVAYSPQGDVIVSAGGDGTVRLWDVATGDCHRTLSGHTTGVLCVAFSPNGSQIASGSVDNTIRLWDVETGVCSHILSGHNNHVQDIAYSPRGDEIVSASVDTTVRLWDVESGACRRILVGHSNIVHSVSYSPKGGQVVSGSQDNTVRLWDVETGACRQTITGHGDAVFNVAYSPKGDQVASGSFDSTVRLRDVSVGASRLVSSGHSAVVERVKCSPKGDQIASCSQDRTIRLWDVETGACRRTLSGHNGTVFGIAYSPRGELLVSGGGDKLVRLWDVKTGDCRRTLTGHSNWVICVAFSPQEDVIASGSNDRTVRLWNVTTGECVKTLDGHTDGIMSIAYSLNGSQIATGSKDKTARLWDTGTGECLRALQGHDSWVQAVVYSPQGDQLASASDDKTVRLWDVETGTCRLTLTGHTDYVSDVAYSVKGDLLASGSDDRTMRLWDVSTGQCRAVVQNFPGHIHGIAWNTTLDANYLVTGGEDGSVLKWQVIEEKDLCSVRLCWGATNGTLTMAGASVRDVHGLTLPNKQLLKQRGATGEPEDLLREASKKVVAMASVVSKLKLPSDGTEMGPPSTADSSIEQSEQQIEQMDDSEDTVKRVESS